MLNYEDLPRVFPKGHRLWVLLLARAEELKELMLNEKFDEGWVAADQVALSPHPSDPNIQIETRTYNLVPTTGEGATWTRVSGKSLRALQDAEKG